MAALRAGSFDPKFFLAHESEFHTITRVAKNKIVFSQGEPADAVFYLNRGKAKVFVVSARGKEAVVSIVSTGEFFGERSLVKEQFRTASVVTLTDSIIVRMQKAAFDTLMHQEPAFVDFFLARMLVRNNRVESDLIDQLLNSSERRLARILLLLVDFSNESRTLPMTVKITQETLAEMIGTTRSRVSFFMNKFRKLGYIDYNGSIEVHRSLLDILLQDKS